jgi:hypothetical protein
MVIIIILAVSAIALPGVLIVIGERHMSESNQLVQGSLAGARDAAIHANAPRGIRLLPDPMFPLVRLSSGQIDPAQPLVANRIVPLESAPDYSEGKLDFYAAANYVWRNGTPPPYPGSHGSAPYRFYPVSFMVGGVPFDLRWLDLEGRLHNPNVLCVTESLSLLDPPTSWFWNIRLGDKIRLADSTVYFTVVGPMTVGAASGNSELFVNDGPPGSISQLTKAGKPVEYLFLVNGTDDDGNGFVDDGWDGVDNNRAFGVDDLDEWESENWLPPPALLRSSQSYTIRRRPVPGSGTREVALPSSVVIDLTTWGTTTERSRLPVNAYTGSVDILLNPDGTVVPTTLYSSPSSVGIGGSFLHFWLADRADVATPSTGLGISLLPMPATTPGYASVPVLKSSQTLITLDGKSGRVATTTDPRFDGVLDPANLRYGTETPFMAAKQGAQ